MDLVDGLLGSSSVHPLRGLKLLSKLSLDIGDDGIAKLLGFSREGLLDEKPAQDPAQAVVNMANTLTPPFRCRVRVLKKVRHDKKVVLEMLLTLPASSLTNRL